MKQIKIYPKKLRGKLTRSVLVNLLIDQLNSFGLAAYAGF